MPRLASNSVPAYTRTAGEFPIGGAGLAVLIGLLLVAVGLFHALNPYGSWYMHYGWRFQDAEPSDFYLGFLRVTGFIVAGIGVIVMLVHFVGVERRRCGA